MPDRTRTLLNIATLGPAYIAFALALAALVLDARPLAWAAALGGLAWLALWGVGVPLLRLVRELRRPAPVEAHGD